MDLFPEPSRSDPGEGERNGRNRPAHRRGNGVDDEEESENEADPNVDTYTGSFTHTARFTPDVL